MKLMKRLLAISLGAALLCPITAYASQADDAAALYNQVQEKSKTITDMNAYYDFKMKVGIDSKGGPGESIAPQDLRMEMNVKMNHLTDPDHMRFMAYTRMTAPDNTQMTNTQYYMDGYNYMDMLGKKIKYPMPLADIMKQVTSATSAFDTPSDMMKDLSLTKDQDGNRVLGFSVDSSKMNDYMQTVLGSTGIGGLAKGAALKFRNMSGQYVVDSNGDLIKVRFKMGMDVTQNGHTVTTDLDGDVGIADPGQPVDVPTPNVSEYTLMEAPV